MRNGSPWSRLRRVVRQDPVAEIDDELQFHLEERARDYVAHGMEPEAARRAAFERLGDLERVRTACTGLLAAERRAEERRTMLSVSWLDVKLGVRMLAKYPGLSLVAVVGMSVAIAIGAGYGAAIDAVLDPALPLPEGDRVVSIRNRDIARSLGSDAGHESMRDYVLWRDELSSVRDLAAFRSDSRNLILADGSTALVEVAAMTASGFRVTRVPAVRGRQLIDEDEREGAPPVVVIAYEEWQLRFNGDPDILGRPVRLGEAVYTVVGVMPEGFRFPINHRYWVPLRLNLLDYEPGGGPSIQVFGRLADGSTLGQARAELATIGQRMAVAFPETHEHFRTQVMPYTHAALDIDNPAVAMALRAVQLVVSLLLVLISVNVAILVYARTVTRTGEIAVRSALGASRPRVVTQLFMEALVLSVAAAAVGLTIAGVALGMTNDFWKLAGAPFWIVFGLSPGLILYVAGLAIVAGAIVGVLPALKATGRRVQSGLQQLSSHGSAMQLGRTWTALIVVQVAIAVAALPAAINFAEQSGRLATRDPAIVANELLRTSLVMAREESPTAVDSAANEQVFQARFVDRTAELIRRLEAEPEVSGVTLASHFPGIEAGARIEVESIDAPAEDTSGAAAREGPMRGGVRTNRVDIDLFKVFDIPILAGRGFVPGDTREGATAVIVSETFAEWIGGGASVLGHRVRYVRSSDGDTERDQWFEIVGVVPDFADDFTAPSTFDDVASRLYHATVIGHTYPAMLAVRVRGGPPAGFFAARLRDIAAAVDPALKLERLETVIEVWDRTQNVMWYGAVGIVAVMLSVLLLSAAGIYAMMSFTVARRRREIGIRVALGADPRRVLTGIFTRAVAQLGTGVLAGLVVNAAFEWLVAGPGPGILGDNPAILLPAVAALIVGVGLLAALGPARRSLSVQPTEALREE